MGGAASSHKGKASPLSSSDKRRSHATSAKNGLSHKVTPESSGGHKTLRAISKSPAHNASPPKQTAHSVPSYPNQKRSSKKSVQNVEPGNCRLRILFVNDVYELDNWPRFQTAVEKLSDENTIVLLPGDFLAPSILSSIDHGKGMVDCLNRCKVQYVCFGNHETDIPHNEMIQRIKDSHFTWINSNMPDLNLGDVKLNEFETVTVKGGGQERRVGLLGLLTEDPTLYRPGAFGGATITPVVKEADRLRRQLYEKEGLDLVVPMTHQSIAFDRDFMMHFRGKGVDNENAFPLVVGAHDHEPYEEYHGGSVVMKTGHDAINVGICDIVWPDPGSKHVEVSVRMQPTSDFKLNPSCQRAVEKHEAVLKELDRAPLFKCAGARLSSRDNRLHQTNVGTILVSALRDSLGAECCVLNAGNIRGSKEYEDDKRVFTYNDLKAEVPFDVEMVVMPLPGKVLAAAVEFTRARSFLHPPESFGAFMQISDDMTFDDSTQRLTHVCGAPLDPHRVYATGMLFMMLTGMDSITPLMEWAADHAAMLPTDLEKCAAMSCPAKLLLVDYFSKSVWYELGATAAMDPGGKGFVTAKDLKRAAEKYFGGAVAPLFLDNAMAVADGDGDGKVTAEDVLGMLMMNGAARRDMDADGDGQLRKRDVEAFAQKMLRKQYDPKMVDRLLADMGVGKSESFGAEEVQQWLHTKFSLETVKVPGQSLERGEVIAVQTRLLQRA